MSLLGPYANQTFTHTRTTGFDANGQATFAAGVSRFGRVEERLRVLANATGETLQSLAQIWANEDSAAPFGPEDKITWSGREWRVIAVERPVQQSGSVPFVRLFLGAG